MKKSENANVKEKKTKTKSTKKTTKIKELEDITVRDLTKDKSILEDLEKIKTINRKQKEENIRFNKEYGFDTPFINEIMNDFNSYLNKEGKKYIDTANESLNSEDDEDDNRNVFLKLILGNDKERILFKELLMTTERYPIYVTIGDYDFFLMYFDEEQDPIFRFNEDNFEFFFSNNINKLTDYIRKSKVQFGVKYDKILILDGIDVKIIEKKKPEPPKEEQPETKMEQPKEEPQKEEMKYRDTEYGVLKSTYRVRLVPMLESDGIIEVFVVTDNPGEIFNYYSVDTVESIKLIGRGINI